MSYYSYLILLVEDLESIITDNNLLGKLIVINTIKYKLKFKDYPKTTIKDIFNCPMTVMGMMGIWDGKIIYDIINK